MALLSVIIPTYNEAGNVPLLAQRLGKVFEGIDFEIIFVDDNSPDGTAQAIRSTQGFGRHICLLQRKGKLGLSTAIRDGLGLAKGDWVLVMDADLSHPPETARELFDRRSDARLVVASRNINGSGKTKWPLSRDMISRGAELLSKPFVGSRTSDPLSGFFLVQRALMENTRIRVKGYKILLNILRDNPDISALDVPYVFAARHSGKTKLDSAEIVNYLFDLARLSL